MPETARKPTASGRSRLINNVSLKKCRKPKLKVDLKLAISISGSVLNNHPPKIAAGGRITKVSQVLVARNPEVAARRLKRKIEADRSVVMSPNPGNTAQKTPRAAPAAIL